MYLSIYLSVYPSIHLSIQRARGPRLGAPGPSEINIIIYIYIYIYGYYIIVLWILYDIILYVIWILYNSSLLHIIFIWCLYIEIIYHITSCMQRRQDPPGRLQAHTTSWRLRHTCLKRLHSNARVRHATRRDMTWYGVAQHGMTRRVPVNRVLVCRGKVLWWIVYKPRKWSRRLPSDTDELEREWRLLFTLHIPRRVFPRASSVTCSNSVRKLIWSWGLWPDAIRQAVWKCAIVGVPWQGSVSAPSAWGDIVSFNTLSKVLNMLRTLRRKGEYSI